MFDGLLPEAKAVILLFRKDGTLLTQTPDLGLTVGRRYSDIRLFTSEADQRDAGIFTAATLPDGIERRVAYQVGVRYPFVIALGLPVEAILVDWRRTSFINAGIALIGALIILALSKGLAVRIQRLAASRNAAIRSERSLAEAQQIGRFGHFERGPNSTVYDWSPNMFAIHGVNSHSFAPTQQTIVDLFVPEDRASVIALTQRHFEAPKTGAFEGRIRFPDGAIRHMRYEWRLGDNGLGESRVFGVALDISELRMAESARRENESRLSDILQCSSDLIWETDADGIFTVFSGAGIDLFHSPIGLDGTTFYVRSDDGGDLAELDQALLQRRQFQNLVIPVRGAAGGQRWVRVSGNPRFDEQGRFLGFRGAGTDVTEQRRQIELLESQRKGEALGRLASGLAHEINNLMQPVMIYASAGLAAEDKARPEEIGSYFSRILRSAEQASTIVRNVLSFARRSPPKREDIALLTVVRESLELTRLGTSPKVKVTLDEASLAQAVRVDRTGLTQALINLFTNAAEAMKNAGEIVVSAEQVAVTSAGDLAIALKPGFYCRLKVRDTGPGIAAENLNRVFDPFFTTKAQGEGTGLGLSVVSGLAKSWGGGVTASNDQSGGAVFSIYLPIVVRQAEAAQ